MRYLKPHALLDCTLLEMLAFQGRIRFYTLNFGMLENWE
jgi:hypothetical protein